MIKVENQKIMLDLAKKEYIKNIKKNILVIIAILLTTFMITAIFSIGVSYWLSLMQRSIMMEGVKYDIQLPEPTKEQTVKAKQMDIIKYAGVSVKCAIVENFEGSTAHIRLFWSDDISWENQYAPAFEFVEGSYPEQENEIMLSAQTLKELGIVNPSIGMELKMTYYDLSENGKTHERTFILSGYYRDYSGDSKGFVSASFYETTGAKQTDLTQGILYISLKNPLYTSTDIKAIQEELVMGDNQMIYADDNLLSNFLKLMTGLSVLLLLIIISGYLFIYNILYISISKEIRFFGQLKTVGSTSKQIRSFVRKQVVWNSAIGIPLGIMLGAVVSFLIVPSVLNALNPAIGMNQTLTFHPIIFIGSALFSLVTVFISSRKPAIIAGNISPIEALKYIAVSSNRKNRKNINGGKLTHMAWRNMFRKKKQAVIIFLSFFVAFTTFFTISILVQGNSAKNILNVNFDYDMRILNETVPMHSPSQEIGVSLLEQIEMLDGVASVRKVISSKAVIPYDEAILGDYFKRIFDLRIAEGTYEEQLALYKEQPENEYFLGAIIGIDEAGFVALNEKLGRIVSKEEFMSGNVGIINGFIGISVSDSIGKDISYLLPEASDKHTIRIAAEYTGGINYFASGYAPSIIISEQLISELLDEPTIELADINYMEPFDVELDETIKALFSDEDEVTFNSKSDDYDEMKLSENQMKILGGGLGIILALLAILNYCNMITTGIQNRTKEFASLQSIGMTSKQQRQVLILEGMGYGFISILLVSIIGLPIGYMVFQSMNTYNVAFSIPIMTNVILVGVILLVCVLVPLVVYQITREDNIVEQLKEID